MKNSNQLNTDKIYEDDIYSYTNQYGTYYLQIIPQLSVSPKMQVLTDNKNLENLLSTEIDKWEDPETIEQMDLNITVFENLLPLNPSYLLTSYKVHISLANANQSLDLDNKKENKYYGKIVDSKILLDFKSFVFINR